MLSRDQRQSIRRIYLFEYACREKNGKPISLNGNNFVVPSLTEVKESVFQEILNLGFTSIELVEPSKANCIIRVFQKLHYHYDVDLTYNVYGATCYTLNNVGQWVTSIADFKIDYSKYILRHWLCQDEYIDFDLDFFDCYVKVS